jgi:transposase-like protein
LPSSSPPENKIATCPEIGSGTSGVCFTTYTQWIIYLTSSKIAIVFERIMQSGAATDRLLHSPLNQLESFITKMYTEYMRRTNSMGRMFEEQKEKAVLEVLSGIKTAVVARKYGVAPNTVNQWVRDHREKHGEQEHPYPLEQAEEMKRLLDVENKYEKAIRLLGEKDLEIEILRELLKKPTPAYPRNSK